MPVQNKNLKSLLKHLKMTNTVLASGIGVDSSLVSRWISGARQIKMTSKAMDSLSLFLLSRCRDGADYAWLDVHFIESGLAVDSGTEEERKYNLVLWLASDRAALERNLSSMPMDAVIDAQHLTDGNPSYALTALYAERYAIVIGNSDIAQCLRTKLERLNNGDEVSIFLSTVRAPCVLNRDFCQTLTKYAFEKKLSVSIIVSVAGSSSSIAEIVNAYFTPIIMAQIQVFIIYSSEQSIARRVEIIFGDSGALTAMHTARATTLPIGCSINDIEIARDMYESFKAMRRYTYPIGQLIDDNQPRRVLDIIFSEYSHAGGLDILKDGLNPMYAAAETFFSFLSAHHQGEELRWRVEEYFNYKKSFDEAMTEGGETFREIIPLAHLERIIEDGFSTMPGVFFMESGIVSIDARGCVAMLEGYLWYLEHMPNFHLFITKDLPENNRNGCWHIKHNQHVAIQRWDRPSPIMILSDQVMILQRIQEYFNEIWRQGNPLEMRAHSIRILHDAITRITERHLS